MIILYLTSNSVSAFDVDLDTLNEYQGYTIAGVFNLEKIIKESDGISTTHKLVLNCYGKKFVLTSKSILIETKLIGILPRITKVLVLTKKMSFKDKNGIIISYLDTVAIINNNSITIDPVLIKK